MTLIWVNLGLRVSHRFRGNFAFLLYDPVQRSTAVRQVVPYMSLSISPSEFQPVAALHCNAAWTLIVRGSVGTYFACYN